MQTPRGYRYWLYFLPDRHVWHFQVTLRMFEPHPDELRRRFGIGLDTIDEHVAHDRRRARLPVPRRRVKGRGGPVSVGGDLPDGWASSRHLTILSLSARPRIRTRLHRA